MSTSGHLDEPLPGAVDTSKPVSLLVVDDNRAKRLALRAVLEPLGYLVIEADSGLAALRCIAAQEFAAILLDVRMPEMDGFETAELIRLRRQSEVTPIIFITASGPDEIETAQRYAGGAVDFIFAPVHPEELRAKVSVFAKLFTKSKELAGRAAQVQGYADRLRLLTDSAPIGIFQTDVRNRYTYTNPRWCEITGIPTEDAAGQQWDSILDPGQRAELLAGLTDGVLFLSDLTHRFTLGPGGPGARIALMTSKAMLDAEGKLTGWVGTLADVTAEVGAEAAMSAARDEATEASRLKSDFLANMSHEIRTPMNGVIGMTDLLLETDLDSRQRDYAQTVRNSGEALLTIINDILDFSKVEAGMLEIETIEFDVRSVVDDVVHLLANPAQAKGLELVVVVDDDVPSVVVGDPGRVRQVLTNLLGNATKFTQSGTIVLRVTRVGSSDQTTTLRFEVRDTGDGISADKLSVIFQPFVQADTSTSRRYGGTGLGLAICSELVALMGGQCGATSSLDVGSTFWFTIGVAADEDQPTPELLGPDAGLVGVRALVVDDNVAQLDALRDLLATWGMSVTRAGSAEAALNGLRAGTDAGEPVMVALVDQMMPDLDGLWLAAAVAADSALSTRVVVMTTLGNVLDADGGTPGVCASLSKPIHRDELRACLLVAAGVADPDGATSEAMSQSGTAGGRPAVGRLLLAEDNLVNQKVAVAMLTSAGYEVDTVLNGAAAVKAVAEQVYDAVLMDCQMPEMNGYEATAAIRGREGSGRHIPIIAMTAGARLQDRERCLAEGMDSYLAKPVNKDLLLSIVARSVRTRPAEPAQRANRRSTRVSFDATILDELRGAGTPGDVEFVRQLVDQFVRDAETSLVQLREALRVGDAGAVARLVHGLKGSSGQLGGLRLAASCGRLEEKAAAHDLLDGPTEIDQLQEDFEELRGTLEQQLSRV